MSTKMHLARRPLDRTPRPIEGWLTLTVCGKRVRDDIVVEADEANLVTCPVCRASLGDATQKGTRPMSDRWAASRPLDPKEHERALVRPRAEEPPPGDPQQEWTVVQTAGDLGTARIVTADGLITICRCSPKNAALIVDAVARLRASGAPAAPTPSDVWDAAIAEVEKNGERWLARHRRAQDDENAPRMEQARHRHDEVQCIADLLRAAKSEWCVGVAQPQEPAK